MSNDATIKQAWAIVANAISWVLSTIIGWMRHVALLFIVASILAILAKANGVPLPFATPGHVELAYIAGAYWLSK